MYTFFIILGLFVLSIILGKFVAEVFQFAAVILGIIFTLTCIVCLGCRFSNSETEKYSMTYDALVYRLSNYNSYETKEKIKLIEDIGFYNRHVEATQHALQSRWVNWMVEPGFMDLELIEIDSVINSGGTENEKT